MKVKALVYFTDLQANMERAAGDEFEVSQQRYEELANHPQFGALVEPAEKPKRTSKNTTKKD